MLEKAALRPPEMQGDWLILTTPGRDTAASIEIRAPRLQEVIVSNSEGAVEANGIDGPLTVDTGADQVKADRIHGDCTLSTGGGEIHVGKVDGMLSCTTGAGAITAKWVGRKAVLRTNLRRTQMTTFFKNLAPAEIALEACGSSHHWARD